MPGALAGFRVIEAASGIAGPYLAQLLAEQGADVFKLEPPEGDPLRASAGFNAINRSKRSATLALETPAGRAQLISLLRGTDLFIHDSAPSRRARLGLEHERLAEETGSAGLVTCWMPPYGSTGPHAERAADDALVQAVDGIAGNQTASRPGPVFLTMPLTSYGAAMLAAGACCAALLVRAQTGHGQEVEVSWLAGGLALQTGGLLLGEGVSRIAGAAGNPLGGLPVYRAYRTADGSYLFLACGNPAFFHRFCLLIERPELISDPRFEGAPWGLVNPDDRAALSAILEPLFLSRPRDEWLAALQAADVPCAPVATRDEYLDDPQVRHNQMRLEIDDPLLSHTVQAGVPVWTHGTPGGVRSAAPLLGEHQTDLDELAAAPAGPARSGNRSLPPKPLAGVRVLDLSGYIAGALAPMLLGDWGADVIKVEGPDGDAFRTMAFGFLGWNRSKRGLCIDLKRAEGQALLHELVRDADALMENFRPGVAQRLAADYGTLSAINPRLVYCTDSAYGSSGPYAARPGFDPLMQSRSGAMAAQGGMAHGNPPVFLTAAISDYGGAILSAFAIAAGLVARERTGVGQRVETALVNSVMAMQVMEFLRYPGGSVETIGGRDFLGPSALVRLYACADGWLMLAARDAAGWAALAEALDTPDVTGRFSPAAALVEPPDGPLASALAELFAAGTTSAWLERLDRAAAPVAPVVFGPDVFADEHIAANRLLARHRHPLWGSVQQTGELVKFSRTPASVDRVAPLLGEHSVEVLREFGVAEGRIETLLASGVVIQSAMQP